MAFIKSELLEIRSKELRGLTSETYIFNENNRRLLLESQKNSKFEFDIFLSHSFNDRIYVLGVFRHLIELGYTVYVDWIADPQLDRNNINKETSNTLRNRMKESKSLFYMTSENASNSKWMPWELGFMDGHKEKAAILPILDSQRQNWNYQGQEYLGIYPYVIEEYQEISNIKKLWICESPTKYVEFEAWLLGVNPIQR